MSKFSWDRVRQWWREQDIFDVYRKDQEREERARFTEETIERHRTLIRQAEEIEREKSRAELRDRFAAAALTGMHSRDSYDEGLSSPEKRARLAYIDANAMMKERDK
jgi:hypothetical protein